MLKNNIQIDLMQKMIIFNKFHTVKTKLFKKSNLSKSLSLSLVGALPSAEEQKAYHRTTVDKLG